MELANDLHKKDMEQATSYHHKEMQHAEFMHKYELETSKKIYLWDASTQMEQHLQQLNADLINANREADRDMYEQRNSQFQTIIVSSTVMFAALCTVIIEGLNLYLTTNLDLKPFIGVGQLPVDSSRFIELGMAVFAGSSFSMLFISIVLSLEIVFRTTRYMYERARSHNAMLVRLVYDMKEVMDDLKEMRQLADVHDPMIIDKEFSKHYKRMLKFMTCREQINDHMFRGQGISHTSTKERMDAVARASEIDNATKLTRAVRGIINRIRRASGKNLDRRAEDLVGFDDGELQFDRSLSVASKPDNFVGGIHSFSDFWDKHCRLVATVALFSFYIGTCFLLLDIAVYMWAKFKITYHNGFAGLIIAAAVFGSLSMGLLILFYMRWNNKNIFRKLKADSENSIFVHSQSIDIDESDIEMCYMQDDVRQARSTNGEEKATGGDDIGGSGGGLGNGRRNRMLNGRGVD